MKYEFNSVHFWTDSKNPGKKNESFLKTHSEETVSDLMYEWILFTSTGIKTSSFCTYKNLIDYYILPNLGECRLSDINQDVVDRFICKLLTKGKKDGTGLSAKTTSDVVSILKNALIFAEKRGKGFFNRISFSVPSKKKNNVSVLSDADKKILFRFVIEDKNKDMRNLGILLSLCAGLRVGEVCALQWKDVSLENEEIVVNKTYQRINLKRMSENPHLKRITENTDSCTGNFKNSGNEFFESIISTSEDLKNSEDIHFQSGMSEKRRIAKYSKTVLIMTSPKSESSRRRIPIPVFLAEHLKKYEKSGEIFIASGKVKAIEPRSMQEYFKKVLCECHIQKINYHALRHTFATDCVDLGFDVKCLSEILGHSNIGMTLKRYVHPSYDMKKRNMELLSKSYSKII